MSTQLRASSRTHDARLTTALTLAAAVIVAVIANSIVAFAALAAGASPAFSPLALYVYGPFTALGLIVGYLGWRLVRRRADDPLRLLRALVPVFLVLSFVPDTVSLIVAFIPGTSVTGFVALMIMHPVVVAVGVPVYQRLLPVSEK